MIVILSGRLDIFCLKSTLKKKTGIVNHNASTTAFSFFFPQHSIVEGQHLRLGFSYSHLAPLCKIGIKYNMYKFYLTFCCGIILTLNTWHSIIKSAQCQRGGGKKKLRTLNNKMEGAFNVLLAGTKK